MGEQLRVIVRQQVSQLQKRLSEKGITLSMDDEACDAILRESYDVQYGARPVRRYVESEVTTELSKMLLGGELGNPSTVRIKKARGRDALEYKVEEPRAKAPRHEKLDKFQDGVALLNSSYRF